MKSIHPQIQDAQQTPTTRNKKTTMKYTSIKRLQSTEKGKM